MKWKAINIIFSMIILLEYGIIKSGTDIPINESIPTVSIIEEITLRDIIKNLKTNNGVRIIKIINNKDNYSIQLEITGDKEQFITRLEDLKDCNIIDYELKVKDEEVIGLIMLKYSVNS